jgi:hypothetical protein
MTAHLFAETKNDENRERRKIHETAASTHLQREPSLNPVTDRDSDTEPAID